MKVRKAIIPAAGLGTRLLPNTKSIPKEMLPLVDKPVLQYIVEEAVSAGVEEILIITNRGKSPIEDYFDYAPDLEARLIQDGKLKEAETEASNIVSMGAAALARHYLQRVVPCMEELREYVDAMEQMTDSRDWPMPTYGDLMFRI